MAEDAQERTELPTQKRRDEARKRGELPRSHELNTAAVVLVTGMGLQFLGPRIGTGLSILLRSDLVLSREQAFDDSHAIAALGGSLAAALNACLPLLGLTVVAALLAPLALGGWNLSPGALTPNFTRLSPLAGFGRMFSARSAVELAKAFAKFLLVAIIGWLFLRSKAGELLALGAEPLKAAITHAISLGGSALVQLGAALALIAAVDVPWQLHQYTQKLRMSREEIRQELRESEGAPEVKGRIRSLRQRVARRRMMQEVPKADVVITNPTHFAVALRYDERRMRAPTVTAKGADVIATRIREVATEHLVPIFEAPPLARALHASVDIGEEIPASLYVSVAQVLTYIYQLRAARRGGAAPPTPPALDPSVDAPRH
jgi:flagellar biosynthetic protein FlhB